MTLTTNPQERAALGAIRQVFADQALALDSIFTGTATEAASNGARLCCDMRLALKAQELCRASYKILLALPDGDGDKKFSESHERTNGNGDSKA
jgi:hypothetical protein